MTEHTLTQHILLSLDGSDLATVSVPYARALATHKTELLLLRVVPDPIPMAELAGSAAFPIEPLRQREQAAARSYLEAVAGVMQDMTPNIHIHTPIGSPADEILRVAQEEHADLIIMATHGRGFLGRVVAGSIADRVARAATVPVMLIHPHERHLPPRADARADLRRLLVPLDGSAPARQALPVAMNLAKQLSLPIHLVSAISYSAEFDFADDDVMRAYRASMEQSLADTLQAEASRLHALGITATSEVIIGPAAQSILDVTMTGDVIVMASHGQSGIRRWLLGSVAEKLIRSGVAPLILVPVRERQQIARDIDQSNVTAEPANPS